MQSISSIAYEYLAAMLFLFMHVIIAGAFVPTHSFRTAHHQHHGQPSNSKSQSLNQCIKQITTSSSRQYLPLQPSPSHELRTTQLFYNNGMNENNDSFNATSSQPSDSTFRDRSRQNIVYDSTIIRTSDILAKRIVHRGFATVSQQVRLLMRLKEREEEFPSNQDSQSQNGSSSANLSNIGSPSIRENKKKQKRDVQKSMEDMKKNLELKWNIAQNTEDCDVEDILSCSEPCERCRGRGVVVCSFCKGHGYVDFGEQVKGTVGGRMEKNNGGHTGIECPVCDENGEQSCEKCNGSGWIARWRT